MRALVANLKINGITEAANINKSKSAQQEQENQQLEGPFFWLPCEDKASQTYGSIREV